MIVMELVGNLCPAILIECLELEVLDDRIKERIEFVFVLQESPGTIGRILYHAGAKADPGLDLGIVGGARMLSKFDCLLALFLSTSGRLKVLEVELVVTGLARVDNIAEVF